MAVAAPRSEAPLTDRSAWRRRLVVGLLLTLPVLVFFAPSIFDGRAPGGFDLIYTGSPWRDAEVRPTAALSPVQIDQAEQLPWVDGAWADVADGHFPAWTPQAGGGQALGTNPIFATWSVFTVAGAPFSPAVGVVIRAVLAVYLAEVFLYWFLRRLGLGVGPAVFGAVAYAFCGTPVAFLTRNALPLLLPVALVAVDALAERRTPGRIIGVAAVVAAAWLEGFPAMLVHLLAASGGWWVVRTGLTHGWDGRRPGVARGWVASGTAFVAALGLGGLVSAASVVPFALQIRANDVLEARDSVMTPLPMDSIWWLIDDNALGNPQHGPWLTIMNPYEGLAAVGTLVMTLALGLALVVALAQVWPRARRLASFGDGPAGDVRRAAFVAAAVVAAVLVTITYVGTPLLDLAGKVPGVGGNPISRTRFVLDLALIALAALGLDAIVRRAIASTTDPAGGAVVVTPHDGTAAPGRGTALAGVVVLAALAWPMRQVGGEYIVLIRNHHDVLVGSWASELALTAVAVAGTAALLWWQRRRPGTAGLLAVGALTAAVAFLQVGLPTSNLTPQVDRAFYYPATEGQATLTALTGGEHRFIGNGMSAFRPNTAMVEGSYDSRSHAFQDPQWRVLLDSVWGDTTGVDPLKVNVDIRGATRWGSPVLDDLAIQTLVLSSSDIPLGVLEAVPSTSTFRTVRPGEPLEVGGPSGPFVGLDTHILGGSRCQAGDVVLEATADGLDRPARARRPVSDAWGATQTGATFLLAVPADAVTDSAVSRLTISLEGTDPGCDLQVGVLGPDSQPVLAAGLITRPIDADWRLAAAEEGWYYVRDSAPTLVRVEGSWRNHPDASTALAAAVEVGRTADDPLPVSGASTDGDDGPDGTVVSWSAGPHGVQARVDAPEPAVVVASFNSAPGWTALVDGRSVPLVEADGALLAAQVPAGDHDVEFRYDMPGLRGGIVLTLVGLLGGVALVVLWPIVARRRSSKSHEMLAHQHET